MQNLFKALLATSLLASVLPATAAQDPPVPTPQERQGRDISDFHLEKGLALEGYDPVAYFPEGGGKPAKGSEKITSRHEGVMYRFRDEATRGLFEKDPAKYEPMYGGWCAFTMADDGSKEEPSPRNFLVEDGRLYVFFDGWFGDGRKAWLKQGAKSMKPKADANWKKILDETARKKKQAAR
jgi:hypothetical protein